MMVIIVDIVFGDAWMRCVLDPNACELVISVLSQYYKTVKDCATKGCVSDGLGVVQANNHMFEQRNEQQHMCYKDVQNRVK